MIAKSANFEWYLYGHQLKELFSYKFHQFYHLCFSYFNECTTFHCSYDFGIMNYY